MKKNKSESKKNSGKSAARKCTASRTQIRVHRRRTQSTGQETDPERAGETIQPDGFLKVLPAAICAAYGLRDLLSICYFFPGSIAPEESKALYDALMERVNRALEFGGSALRGAIPRPELGEKESIDEAQLIAAGLLMCHPDGQLDATGKYCNAREILAACQANIDASLRRLVDRLFEIVWFRCLMPCPVGEPVYSGPGRTLRMTSEYWRLVRQMICDVAGSLVGHQPYPLTPVAENLRVRIEVGFQHLDQIDGAGEALESITELIQCLLTDAEALHAVPEYTDGKVGQIESFFVRARMRLEDEPFALTSPEERFLEQASAAVSAYAQRLRAGTENVRSALGGDGSIEQELPALDTCEFAILAHMRRHPGRLCQLQELATATGVSRKTIGMKVDRLIQLKLVWRPNGERKGATITTAGRTVLAATATTS